MKTKTIVIALTLIFLISLLLSLGYKNADAPGLPSERFLGYNKEQDQWTTGNLGSAYVEGDFVSYQLRIDTASKVWGATEFSISFNFHQDSSNAIYVDGFDISTATGFQYQIDGSFLPDGQPTPSPAWTHIPTPEAGESWSSGPKITNYMDPWPPGTAEPSNPNSAQVADERYFSVNGLPWGSATDNIIVFYRAHLALSIIWSTGLESNLPQVLDGGEFNDWTNMFNGASFATGSSRHFFLQYPGIGGKTIPIPIAQYPSTLINGHKYVNNVLFNGWQITLTGQLTLGSGLPPIPYNPPPVLTGTTPWTTGYFEFTGLVTGSYTVDEEERSGYGHLNIVVSGDATNIVTNIAGGWASFDLVQGGTATVDFYNSRPSRTTTLLSSSTITLGQSITDTATVTSADGSPPIPTGTVTFYVGTSTSGPWTQVGAVKSLVSGSATSDSYTPLATGTYYFKASYSGDSNYLPSESDPATEVLVVNKATPTVTTLLSSSSITLGQSITDTATVTGLGGSFPAPTGTVTFYVGTSTSGPWTQVGAVKPLVGGSATSDSYKPLAAGTYYFKAVYSGDSNYLGAESDPATEVLVVNKAKPTVTTLLSLSTITLGQSITDTATVTGLGGSFPAPTGTVTFYVGTSTSGPWTQVGAIKPLVGGSATSDPFMPLATGTYYFKAVYSGDSNYLSAESDPATEVLVVNKATPTVTTLLSSPSITLGQSITDTATVTGLGGSFPVPTGTVTFYVGSSTSGPWTQVGAVKTLDAFGTAVSDSYTPLATGTYYFKVAYSGDSNYLPSESDPATEVLVVNKATPTVTTTLLATTITLGQSITDTATVTGLGGSFPIPTGTATFYVGPSTMGPWTQVGAVKPLVGGMATSDSYTPLAAGTYYFKAVYSGDSNYLGAESEPATEVLVANKATPTVTTLLSDATITLGESITDQATVTGLGGSFPIPSGTVTFWVSTSVAGPWTQVGAAKPLVGGVATSDSFTPLSAGTYYFKAVYSGDSNYLGAESDPATEVLVVNKATPTVTTELSATTITLGQSITDTATVTGLGGSFPVPTGTVTFYVGTSTSGPWTQVGAVKSLVGGVATSDSYTPLAAGTYYFKAVYSGDSNYVGAESDPATEVLVVTPGIAHTVGYWKNHPEDWVGISPSATFPWTTGSVAGFTYMQILETSPGGDASIILAQQYIAAKLNFYAYGVPSYIATAIADAEAFFAGTSTSPFYPTAYPAGSNPPDGLPSSPRAYAINLASILEAYNSS